MAAATSLSSADNCSHHVATVPRLRGTRLDRAPPPVAAPAGSSRPFGLWRGAVARVLRDVNPCLARQFRVSRGCAGGGSGGCWKRRRERGANGDADGDAERG